jgi:hypothetical protein
MNWEDVMRNLTLSIDPRLFPRFPALRLGAFVALRLDRAAMCFGATQFARLYRTIGLRHRIPIGAYDIDALPDPVMTLRSARPLTDWFVPRGARPSDLPLRPDLVVLAAGSTVLSWGVNESRQTCLCETTRSAAFVSEAITRAQREATFAALDDLRRFLGAAGALIGPPALVDALRPSAELKCESVRTCQPSVERP